MGKISKALNNIAVALESIANASNNKQEEPTPALINTQKNQTSTVTSTGYQGQSIYSVHRDFDKYSASFFGRSTRFTYTGWLIHLLSAKFKTVALTSVSFEKLKNGSTSFFVPKKT